MNNDDNFGKETSFYSSIEDVTISSLGVTTDLSPSQTHLCSSLKNQRFVGDASGSGSVSRTNRSIPDEAVRNSTSSHVSVNYRSNNHYLADNSMTTNGFAKINTLTCYLQENLHLKSCPNTSCGYAGKRSRSQTLPTDPYFNSTGTMTSVSFQQLPRPSGDQTQGTTMSCVNAFTPVTKRCLTPTPMSLVSASPLEKLLLPIKNIENLASDQLGMPLGIIGHHENLPRPPSSTTCPSNDINMATCVSQTTNTTTPSSNNVAPSSCLASDLQNYLQKQESQAEHKQSPPIIQTHDLAHILTSQPQVQSPIDQTLIDAWEILNLDSTCINSSNSNLMQTALPSMPNNNCLSSPTPVSWFSSPSVHTASTASHLSSASGLPCVQSHVHRHADHNYGNERNSVVQNIPFINHSGIPGYVTSGPSPNSSPMLIFHPTTSTTNNTSSTNVATTATCTATYKQPKAVNIIEQESPPISPISEDYPKNPNKTKLTVVTSNLVPTNINTSILTSLEDYLSECNSLTADDLSPASSTPPARQMQLQMPNMSSSSNNAITTTAATHLSTECQLQQPIGSIINYKVREYYVCHAEGCHKTFSKKTQFNAHMRSQHGMNKDFICFRCNKKFSRGPDLYRHNRSIHKEGHQYECLDCRKCFGRMDAIKRHRCTGVVYSIVVSSPNICN